MAAGNVARILRAPGRLIVNPTTAFATTTFPYGGTEIGKTNVVALVPQGSMFRVEYEGLGEAGDILEANIQWKMVCFVRGWDDDAVALLRPEGYTVGAVTQHAVFSDPPETGLRLNGSTWSGSDGIPGSSALDRAVTLAYVPDDPEHVPGMIMYRGVPDWHDGVEIAFQRRSELGLPMMFECFRNDNNRMIKIGMIADLPTA